jgi:hypothetical protein
MIKDLLTLYHERFEKEILDRTSTIILIIYIKQLSTNLTLQEDGNYAYEPSSATKKL